jgi:Homing endonuclease associated repeat
MTAAMTDEQYEAWLEAGETGVPMSIDGFEGEPDATELLASPTDESVSSRDGTAGAVSPSTNGKKPRGYWTKDTIVAAIQQFAQEHGRAPGGAEMHSAEISCRKFGWKWSDAVEAAGFARPSKSTRYSNGGGPPKRRTSKPKPAADRSANPRSEPQPEPEPDDPPDDDPLEAMLAARDLMHQLGEQYDQAVRDYHAAVRALA